MHDAIIIGAGPAGMTAAIYCVRKGLDTLVIGKDVGGQIAKSGEIANWLGVGSTTGGELAIQFHNHVEEFKNITHKHGVSVTGITKNDDVFGVTTEEDTYKGKVVIIATGRSPRKLNIPGEAEFTNKGVSYCDVCDGPLFKGKEVAIVGGGNSAMEAALSMAVLSPKVYVLTITSQLTGDEVLIKKIKESGTIEVITEAFTKEIVGNAFVTGLTYEKNKEMHTIEIGGVFIEVGYVPSNKFETLTKKDKQNRIITDPTCATNVPGIYAAGDANDSRDNQIIIAAGEGATAALSAFYYLTHAE